MAQTTEECHTSATNAYNWAIDNGIAKEQARAVLPEGNTMSRLYVNGTLRSWIHYIELRSANGTQLEHIDLAKAPNDDKLLGKYYTIVVVVLARRNIESSNNRSIRSCSSHSGCFAGLLN